MISWNWVGKLDWCVVWEIMICFDFSGLCSMLSMWWLNLGSLFRNNMLLCVSEILFGCG